MILHCKILPICRIFIRHKHSTWQIKLMGPYLRCHLLRIFLRHVWYTRMKWSWNGHLGHHSIFLIWLGKKWPASSFRWNEHSIFIPTNWFHWMTWHSSHWSLHPLPFLFCSFLFMFQLFIIVFALLVLFNIKVPKINESVYIML